MTTTADLINETKRHLLSGEREQLNKVSGSLTDSATTVTFTYAMRALQEGAVISVGLEMMYVWAADATAKTATVERGWLGSTAAAHADGAVVTVNPRYSDFAIFQALNDELDDLSSPSNGLFKVATVDLTYSASYKGYDLTSVTGLLGVIDVFTKRLDGARNWPRVKSWSLRRDLPTADFASGLALMIDDPADAGATVRVVYRKPYTALATTSDNVETVSGLHAQAHDIPPLGAAARLAAMRLVKRTEESAQGEPRRAEEVPPQSLTETANVLLSVRRTRVNAEAARLVAQYPPRGR